MGAYRRRAKDFEFFTERSEGYDLSGINSPPAEAPCPYGIMPFLCITLHQMASLKLANPDKENYGQEESDE